jgi:3-deoxy-D-manno-octulosonate 8-phosphate phosphatase (KDO 8-P phosphatase)
MKIELLILDVDGVLTDGTKVYDIDHNVLSKRYMCKDFTAIKRFIAAGVKVVMLSGDNFNRYMAEKRNIDFYCSRNKDLSLDKARYLEVFSKKYNININKMAFVGDDYFDLSIVRECPTTFCPSDSPSIIKENSSYILKSKGGEGVLIELYDLFINKNWINEPTEKSVADLDKKEISSKEME